MVGKMGRKAVKTGFCGGIGVWRLTKGRERYPRRESRCLPKTGTDQDRRWLTLVARANERQEEEE